MPNKRYRIRCNTCGNPNMYEQLSAVCHKIESSNIMLINIPFFFCENCGNIAYRRILGVKDILYNAYHNNYNVVIFGEKDFDDLIDLDEY